MLHETKFHPSQRVLDRLESVEREAESGDPFLAACKTILETGTDEVLQGFVFSIYSALDQIGGCDQEADHLRKIKDGYLLKRRRGRMARDAG